MGELAKATGGTNSAVSALILGYLLIRCTGQ